MAKIYFILGFLVSASLMFVMKNFNRILIFCIVRKRVRRRKKILVYQIDEYMEKREFLWNEDRKRIFGDIFE